MKTIFSLAFLLMISGCSESGFRKGHAGAQGSQFPVFDEPAGAQLPSTNFRNNIVYGADYVPARNFESSVLNEPDEHGANDAAGRGYRVNGSGYGFER